MRLVTEAMANAGYDATRLADGTPQFAEAGFCLGHAGNIYSAMREAEISERDGCEFCLGAKGGAPGNENVLYGRTICDHCSTLIETPSPEEGFTVEQWRSAGARLSEAMEHGECTENELVRVVVDALGLPRIKPELILRDMLEKNP